MDSMGFLTALLLTGFLGLGGAVLGLAGLLTRRGHGVWSLVVRAFAGALAAGAAGLGAMGLPFPVWGPVLGLAVVVLLCRSSQPRPSRRPWLAGALVLSAPLLALWSGSRVLALTETGAAFPTSLLDALRTSEVDAGAVTDLRRPIPVYRREHESPEQANDLSDAEVIASFEARLIRAAAADPVCNCHGWVYTGGRYWIHGRDVDLILADNGYKAVTEPRPGDVVAYREHDGEVSHSGVVRVAQPGLILIESKWGPWGRFLHRPEDQAYGDQITYYRSPRQGHVLKGLDLSPPEVVEAPLVSAPGVHDSICLP